MNLLGADGEGARALPPDPALDRDEVSDAWMLAVADEARGRSHEYLHVWLMSNADTRGVAMGTLEDTVPANAAATGGTIAVAWFEPATAVMAETLAGSQREAQVEAAIMLGMPRWLPDAEPPKVSAWMLASHPMGLSLRDPTGQRFAHGIAEVAPAWTSSAIGQGAVLTVYGVGPKCHERHADPLHAHRLAYARHLGTVAAGWVRFLH
ncbi:hypothetical protein [Micromonospora thermarum]|uniref:Uncharacterized protein n=1 Tax=Micromonospora thermarum TaxID=2720024 RepID=A0ABX0ZCA8_9ACTN|nr:hypothetical protein [Micromonospora thermarum]NJP35561.1 hypothetical protein [Micromonospora thermarum]